MNRMAADDWSMALERDYDRADRLYGLAGVRQLLAYVAAIVVFLIWFHRVRVNAEVFDPSGIGRSGAGRSAAGSCRS